ncbi:MAG: hypothetical protein AAFQ73_08740 [Pseudomonadota bacterium]
MSAPWFYILGILGIFVMAWLAEKAFGDGGTYDASDEDFWDYEDRKDARHDRGRRRRRKRG